MIDVSDGLGIDLDRLATASGVGVVLDTVPTAEGATRGEALAGGEDYELVFAAPDRDAVTRAFGAAGLRPPYTSECVSRTRRVGASAPMCYLLRVGSTACGEQRRGDATPRWATLRPGAERRSDAVA